MANTRIGGSREENDTYDSDQKAYGIHFNKEPFHEFNAKYRKLATETFARQFEQLSIDMMTHFNTRQQPEEEFERKMAFCRLLKRVIQKHNPCWLFDIVPTGSSVSGLATADSDLDVAVHIPQAFRASPDYSADQDATKRRIQLEILQIIRRILVNDEEILDKIDGEVQLVMAQIQILKIVTTDGIECDVSVVLLPFLSSMHNSFLIRHFVHYAMVLLVIHFLQSGTYPPILPHLQQIYRGKNFIAWDDVEFPSRLDFGAPLPKKLPGITKNCASVAVLFFEFVNYYMHFKFDKHFVSIRNARVMSRVDTGALRVTREASKKVYIEDPFDEHNPGRTVSDAGFANIRFVLRDTLNLFVPPEDVSEDQPPFTFPTLDDIIKMMKPVEADASAPEGESPENGAEEPEIVNEDTEETD